MQFNAEEDGARLRARRELVKLTQAQLAEAIGVTQQSVSFMEIGRRVPQDHVKAAIALALGCEISTIWRPPSREQLLKLTRAS